MLSGVLTEIACSRQKKQKQKQTNRQGNQHENITTIGNFIQRKHHVAVMLKLCDNDIVKVRKHPRADGNVIDSGEPFLHLVGARISLRFLDLRKNEIMEFEGKSSLKFWRREQKMQMLFNQPINRR